MLWVALGAGLVCLVQWSAVHPAALIALLAAGTLPTLVAFLVPAAVSGLIAARFHHTLAAQCAAADLGRFLRENTGFRTAPTAIRRPSPGA